MGKRWRGQAKQAHVLQQLKNTIFKAQSIMGSIELLDNSENQAIAAQNHDRSKRMRKSIDEIVKSHEGKFDTEVVIRARMCSDEITRIVDRYQLPRLEVLAQPSSVTGTCTTHLPEDYQTTGGGRSSKEHSAPYQSPEQLETSMSRPLNIMEKDRRRLSELKILIDNANTLMSEIEKTLPYISHSVLNDYQKLTRIHTNLSNIINLFWDRGLLELCSQAPIYLDDIGKFVQRHKRYFPNDMKRARPMPPALVDEYLRRRELAGYSSANSVSRNNSKKNHLVEIIDLTMDSDEDVVITLDESIDDTKAKEDEAIVTLQAQREGWLDYEHRRDLALWYSPEQDYEEEILP